MPTNAQTKLRIGFISTMHYPAHPPFKGGAEATSYYASELLARNGHDVYLFQRGSYGPPNVTNIQFDAPSMFDEEHLLAGAILRFAEAEHLDILINTSWIDSFPSANLMGYGPPMMFWLPLPYGSFPAFDANLQRYSSWDITRYKLFVQTQTQASEYFRNAIQVSLFYVPVPLGPYAYIQEHQVSTSPESYYVWAGRPTYEKAPDRAIEFATKNRCSIRLYGSRESELWKELKHTYRHNGTIQFNLGVDPEEIVASMRNARATLFLNRDADIHGVPWQEPGSRVIMESLLQGCPVIGTENGCLLDWIQDGVNGFFARQEPSWREMNELDDFVQKIDRKEVWEKSISEWSEDQHYRRIMDAITRTLS